MNYLLDIHALIWFIEGNKKLSKSAKEIIEDTDNIKIVSIASIWEIALKISINKLKFERGFENFLFQIEANGFEILQISFEHIITVASLDFIHRDPFDRLIIAQAMNDKLTIITKDGFIAKYKATTIW